MIPNYFRFLVLGQLFLLSLPNYLYSQDTVDDGGHEQWEFILEGSGDVLQLALPITALSVTLIEKDYQGTKQFAYSYGSAMLLTHTLKHLIHKQRPEGRERYDSFPSGHTASAFSGASFIQKRYGWKYAWPAYILATVVGVSRMEGPDGYHDIWDVIAGASVGVGTTYLFTNSYNDQPFDIGFASGNNNYLLTIRYHF
ncbi:MAG: phosphatase PAP2 family protein [Flavobacteriaceae bacterium]|nr:phosphatase PAP2 family protein [Flavobacteriaceae bacterium]